MTEDELLQRCRRILARLCGRGWMPMRRCVFPDWTHADYEALDTRLQSSALRTRRYILPEHEGILVRSGGDRAPRTPTPFRHASPPHWAGGPTRPGVGTRQNGETGGRHGPFLRKGTAYRQLMTPHSGGSQV